ncbi:MAG: PTS sugar transporter subunit IIA [Sedimentisphaerales bacterium]|nr:PTS sugar transporter subunit IIA [Sedimentisphaerales bacterium]
MKLIDVLRQECVVAGAQFADKAEAICEVAAIAKRSPILAGVSEQNILTSLQDRESLGSTGFGGGIAIPHCRLKSVKEFVVGIITAPQGVGFEALDGEPVTLLVFIIAPELQSSRHMKLLSAISQTLLIPGATEELLKATSSEAVFESFLRHTRADIDVSEQTAKSLINVFVADENVFREVLEKLTGLETSSLVIVNTEQSTAYLAKMPLFADFWRDKSSDFGMLIMVVLQKALVNEAVRRIETVTGDLDKCSGVMVTAQDIFYSAGDM